jgi:hypothetical protein
VREDLKAKARAVNGWIGVSDNEWLALLSRQPALDEVNSWQLWAMTSVLVRAARSDDLPDSERYF